jgi:hypothetical protein
VGSERATRRFRATETSTRENSDRDTQAGGAGVAQAKNPARHLDFLGQADPHTHRGRDRQDPPPPGDRTEDQAADYEDEKNDLPIIGVAEATLKSG